jgi:hypothetical protein
LPTILTKQAQLYLNAQGEERQVLVNQIANEYDDYAEILIYQLCNAGITKMKKFYSKQGAIVVVIIW